ncbi:hypothetical protein YH65_07910 [Sulfurovum lithotrophicum]|uniref:Lipoprotein n=1 Tax=Sulfurovum lithotrophicum TaxID=206403 RepID=A0A7U4M1W7_9BACT|nr:hypothetical protein [Sulfurovum lithotrophicum]AKF25322.1 hypothetical protein YH65_07910 [Sulfurovum lithotrophicum]
MRYFMILLSMLFLSGCIPYADHALTKPNKEQIDPSILGTWFWKDDRELGYIHIGLDKETKLIRLIMIEMKKDGRLKSTELFGHTSSLKGNKYLNLKWTHPEDNKSTGYMFMKYSVTSDGLGIGFMNSEVAEKAIKAGTLKGKVEKGKWLSSVYITEGSEKLQKFILKNDKALFPEMKYLARLKLPDHKVK